MNSGTTYSFATKKGTITIRSRHLEGDQYIEFLARTDLGSQYPLERFRERIGKLVKNTQISLIAENEAGIIVGVCFGLTDFAYWLMVTDLGIDREYERLGLGRELVRLARELSGGTKDIIMFINANEDAIPFYEKIGMERADSMMELSDDVEWTDFTVQKGVRY